MYVKANMNSNLKYTYSPITLYTLHEPTTLVLVFAKPTTMDVDFAVVMHINLGVVPTTFWLNDPYLP
jgi:hypothetical protein